MKQTSLLFVFFCWCLGAWGQKSDYVWLSGYYSYAGYDSATNHRWGLSKMNFNNNPVHVSYDSINMNFSKTNTSYCDSNGNLMFYTNGIYVANGLDEKIENSDSLNWGPYIYYVDNSIFNGGYRNTQGILALPSPSNPNQYYLSHTYTDTVNGSSAIVNRLLYTLLDMSENAGHGKVLEKNILVLQGNFFYPETAIKHANGRDWWIIIQNRGTNCYSRILLEPTDIHEVSSLQCIGNVALPNNLSTFTTSPDGSKLVYFSVAEGVNVFDFDRCNGELSNPTFLPILSLPDSGWYLSGAAISPSNQFLYIGATQHVYQYDLWASNIDSSRVTIATYDGSLNPLGSYFSTMQLGPDGKIYEGCGNTEFVFHVIDRPDEKGDSCLFRQHGIELPSFCGGVPNFPNYRLGALPGSPCDTLTGLSETARAEKEKILIVFPNPASDVVTVDYGFTDWNKGAVRLEIINELGQVVHEQSLPMYSGFQKIEVGGFAAGVYQVMVKRGNGVVGVSKFTKQ